MIFAGDVISPTQEVDVSDFQSSLGEVSAAGLNLAYESGLAWSGAINTGLTGQGTYGLSAPDSPMFDHDTALQHVKNAGLSFDVPVEGVSRATLDLMIQRKRNQQKYMSIINRGGTGSSVAALAGDLVGAMVDPAAIFFMFTPVPILTTRLTSRLLMTEGILGRAAIRAQMGAAEGALGAALMEPLLASNLKQLGDDYTMMNSLANVSFGAIAGGILGPGVGALGDFIETSFLGKTLGKEGFKKFMPEWETRAKSMLNDLPEIRKQIDGKFYGELAEAISIIEKPDLQPDEFFVAMSRIDNLKRATQLQEPTQPLREGLPSEISAIREDGTLSPWIFDNEFREAVWNNLDDVSQQAYRNTLDSSASPDAVIADPKTLNPDRVSIDSVAQVMQSKTDDLTGDLKKEREALEAFNADRSIYSQNASILDKIANASPEIKSKAFEIAVNQVKENRPIDISSVFEFGEGKVSGQELNKRIQESFNDKASKKASIEIEDNVSKMPEELDVEYFDKAIKEREERVSKIVDSLEEVEPETLAIPKPVGELSFDSEINRMIEGLKSEQDSIQGDFDYYMENYDPSLDETIEALFQKREAIERKIEELNNIQERYALDEIETFQSIKSDPERYSLEFPILFNLEETGTKIKVPEGKSGKKAEDYGSIPNWLRGKDGTAIDEVADAYFNAKGIDSATPEQDFISMLSDELEKRKSLDDKRALSTLDKERTANFLEEARAIVDEPLKLDIDEAKGKQGLLQKLERVQTFDSKLREATIRFIDRVNPKYMENLAVEIGIPGEFQGQFIPDFRRRTIQIFNKAISQKRFDRTFIHEFWHSLSQYLPEDSVKAVEIEFKKARQKFVDLNPYFESFIGADGNVKRELLGNEYRKFLNQFPNWKEQFPNKLQKVRDGVRLLANDENYRYFNLDEYFAETMVDRTFDPRQLNPEVGGVWQSIKNFFQNAYDSILNALGKQDTGVIFRDFIRGRYDGLQREGLGDLRLDLNSPEFKNLFGDSKVVDEDGKPLVVYHGTDKKFDVFEMPEGFQKNETSSIGFFFTENKKASEVFTLGDGQVLEVYLNIRNPKIYKSEKIDKSNKIKELRTQFSSVSEELKTLDYDPSKPGSINNSRYFELSNLKKDLQEQIRVEDLKPDRIDAFERMMDDRDKFAEYIQPNATWRDRLVNTNPKEASKNFRESLQSEGYDGIIIEGTEYDSISGQPINQYIAFEPTQIKSIDNIGTFDPNDANIYKLDLDTTDPTQVYYDTVSPEGVRKEMERMKRVVLAVKQDNALFEKIANVWPDKAQAEALILAEAPNKTPEIAQGMIAELDAEVKATTRAMQKTEVTYIDALAEAVKNIVEGNNLKAKEEQLRQLISLEKRVQVYKKIRRSPDAYQGVYGILTGNYDNAENGRISIETIQNRNISRIMGGFVSDLRTRQLFDLFQSRDSEVYLAQALLALGENDTNALRAIPKDIVEIAELVLKYQEETRRMMNENGAIVRKRSDFIASQSHDMLKIKASSPEDYISYLRERLDLEKTFGAGASDEQINQALLFVYQNFVSGNFIKNTGEASSGNVLPSGIGRKVSHARSLHFKDARSWVEYQNTYGVGDLHTSIINGLIKGSKAAGIMEVLGPSHRQAFKSILDGINLKLKRQNKFDQMEELKNRSGRFEWIMDELDGSANIPVDGFWAKALSIARTLETQRLMGGVVMSQLGDLAVAASELKYHGVDPFSRYTIPISNIVYSLPGTKKAQKELAEAIGIIPEAIMGDLLERFDNVEVPGKLNELTNMFMRMTGMNAWTDGQRAGLGLALSNIYASMASQSYANLPKGTKILFKKYGITSSVWDSIRSAKLDEIDGRKYLNPKEIEKIDFDAAQKFRTFLMDRLYQGVLQPDAYTRTITTGGGKRGTPSGEIFRTMFQFKRFMASMFTQVWGRDLAIGKQAGFGKYGGIGELFVMSSLLGFISYSMKEIAKGREPINPLENPGGALAAGALQGGGVGIFGDFIFNDVNRFGVSLLGTMAGPLPGRVELFVKQLHKVKNGESSPEELALFGFNQMNVLNPLLVGRGDAAFKAAAAINATNLFYIRPVLNYLVLHSLQEAANPGYFRRQERRLNKEGRDFLVRPL